jgi:hypothetical protein
MQLRSEYPASRFRAQLLAWALALVLACFLLLPAQEPGGSAKDFPRPDAKTAAANPQLDAQVSRARWRAQQIATRRAEAEYHTARLAREIAEIMHLEYEEGIASQDIATADGEIKLAESDLRRADDRLRWATRMFDKGFVTIAQKASEELGLKKAVFAVEQAQAKRKVLVDYTKPKNLEDLKSAAVKARANELAKKAAWELEKSKESALEREVIRLQATSTTPEARQDGQNPNARRT